MAIGYYQNTSAQGRRLGAELSALTPVQVSTKLLDILGNNESAFNIFMSMNDLKSKTRQVGDDTFKIHEDEFVKVTSTLAATHAAAATTWTVAAGHAELFAPHDIIWDRTANTYAKAVSINTTTDVITLLPNIDSGTDAAGSIGNELWNLGNRMEEGTGVANFKSTEPNEYTNYLNKIDTPVVFTEDAIDADRYYDDDFGYQWKKAGIEHMRKCDLAAVFSGKARLTTTTTETAPTAKGNNFGQSIGWLTWHSTYADSDHFFTENDMTETEWNQRVVEAAFQAEPKGSNEKVALLPIQFLTAVNLWGLSQQRFWSEKKMAGAEGTGYPKGLKFSRYEAPYGTIDFVRYWPFESTIDGGFHYLSVIDKKRIGHVNFKNRPKTRIKRDMVKNGEEVVVGKYQDYFGTVSLHPNVHVTAKVQTFSL